MRVVFHDLFLIVAESRIRGMMKRIERHTDRGPCAREQRMQKIRRLPQSTDVLLIITQKGYRCKDFSLFQTFVHPIAAAGTAPHHDTHKGCRYISCGPTHPVGKPHRTPPG